MIYFQPIFLIAATEKPRVRPGGSQNYFEYITVHERALSQLIKVRIATVGCSVHPY